MEEEKILESVLQRPDRALYCFQKVFPTPFLAVKTTCDPSRLHKTREKEMKSVNLPRQTFIIRKPSDTFEL